MKPERKRQLLLKALKKELKIYLSAFDPRHKYYKRNIKNLYEGLTELGIIDDISTSANFKQFERAFGKAHKSVKEMFVISHLFRESDLSKYFNYENKPMNRIKMIGDVFVHKDVSKHLDENQYLAYIEKKRVMEMLMKDRQDLRDIREAFKEFKKEFKTEKKDFEKFRDNVEKYRSIIKDIEKIHNIPEGKIKDYQDPNFIHSWGIDPTLEDEHKELLRMIGWAEDRIDFNLEFLESRVRAGRSSMKEVESINEKILTDIKYQNKLVDEQIQWIAERFKIAQTSAHESAQVQKFLSKEIPNVVKGLTDVIELKTQLANFINMMDSKRMSIANPWRVAGYGSGGPDRRAGKAKALAMLAVAAGTPTAHVEQTMGDTREGFWKRDLTWVAKEITEYENVFYQYQSLIPQSNVTHPLNMLIQEIDQLIAKLIVTEDMLDEGHPVRDELGHILNIDEHSMTMRMSAEIQMHFALAIKLAKDCIKKCDAYVEYNENLILEAKAKNKSAIQQVREIDRQQRNVDKMLARRKIRNGEPEE